MANNNLLVNIENYIGIVSRNSSEQIPFIFSKYNANSLEDLNPCYYQDVFNELHTIVADN